jgi:hypothetical protein
MKYPQPDQSIGLIFIVLLGILSSCNHEAPRPTIPEDKMVRIMSDLVVADAAAASFSGYQKDSLLQVYYKQVYEMNGVTLADYEKNLRIYADDIERMDRMTQKVSDKFMGEKKPGL